MTVFGQRECWCGKPYAPTPDGRWNHAHIFGHVPTPAREQTTDRAWDAATTRAFAQVKRYDGGTKTAPEDACDVNEGLTNETVGGL